MASEGFKRPMTAQEAVLAELRRKILTGQWAPGSPIRQDSVAADLGVSRVPVREALKILEGEGQVSYVPHKGYIVREFDESELLEVYRLRELLEDEAVREAIPKLTDDDLERMRGAMDEMEALEPGDVAELSDANRRFHLALIEAAGMPRLQHFIRLLRDWADAYRAMLYIDADSLSLTYQEHRAIYEACIDRDSGAVIRLMAQHRSHTIEKLEAMLKDQAAV